MGFDFINPLWYLLIGAAGLSLPILAHLLSRKKYDVVEWGAMQFLELGRDARRKIRLEEILLMLLRMLLIALIALALARPWASGGWLTNYVSTSTRDVVFVIDGSYSMGWQGGAETPHAAAGQWAHTFLDELRPGDSVALLDARDQVRPVIESPTRDFSQVRERLNALPPPSGTSNLAEATARAVQILSRTSNLARDVIVLTDGQGLGWRADDENLWLRFDDLRGQPSVQPRVWVIDVADFGDKPRPNFTVEPLKLTRELTAVDFPIRVRTKIVYTGGEASLHRRVGLEIDGQRLDDKTLNVSLQPGANGRGEASVEFECRFNSPGSHLVSVVLDPDDLPGDDRAEAAVTVVDAIPVLLVDGDPQLDPARVETLFAKAALSASDNDQPLVRTIVVPWDRWIAANLEATPVVILANVPRLTDPQKSALRDFIANGGGALIALGDRVDAAAYRTALFDAGLGPLPATPVKVEEDSAQELRGVHVVDESLDLPETERFRAQHGGGFTEARFQKWWKVELGQATDPAAGIATPLARLSDGPETKPANGPPAPPPIAATAPSVLARLDTSDPLLLLRRYGRGQTLLMTSSLDADWNTLPAKPDYVSFLHEMVFLLASTHGSRNVAVGVPLVLPARPDWKPDQFAFFGPGDTEFAAEAGGDELHPRLQLTDTRLPGRYEFRAKGERGASAPWSDVREFFVVESDRRESDLAPLTDPQRTALSKDDRLTFVADLDELRAAMFKDDSKTELWHLLLFLFVLVLLGELLMTRRLVRGGHTVADEPTEEEVSETSQPYTGRAAFEEMMGRK